jgi:hypothetical protein
MKLTTEYSIRIFDNVSGDCIQLTPNCEGSGLFEIRSIAEGQTVGCLALTPEQADAVVDGIKRLKELNAQKTLIEFLCPGASPVIPHGGVHLNK